MITWSLSIAGTVQTLAEWRVNNVVLRRINLAGDNLTFTAPRAGFETPLCEYGDEIKLIRTEDEVSETWFVGTSQIVPDTAEPDAQSITYTAVSPWRFLAENIFQQQWYNGSLYTSHIITVGTIGFNIKAVLDYAIAQGADLQYLAADLTALAALPPTNEFTEKTCAQVIIEQLQFAPDTVVWFDYTSDPPTLRLQQRGSLSATSLRMPSHDDDSMEKVAYASLTARPDLQVPSVKLNYEIIETIDDQQYLIPSVEVYPTDATGREDGAFNAVLTVQGRTITNVNGTIECETIDTTSLDWWKKHAAVLRDERLTILTGPTEVQRLDRDGNTLATTYDRELLPGGGVIAPWMEVDWQTEIVVAKFATQTISDSDIIRIDDEREIRLELITTNAPAGVSSYSAIASADSGDALPTGLAAYLYNSLSVLHYQGALQLNQAECDGAVSVGQVVNLFGARTEHETMRALVQEVVFNIDSGATSITLGPPRQLSLSDVLGLLQRFRVRRRWTNPDTQDTGVLGDGNGDLELARASGYNNTIPGASVESKYMVKSGAVKLTLDADEARLYMEGSGIVNIDLGDTNGRELKIREVEVCVNNVTQHMLVIASAPY